MSPTLNIALFLCALALLRIPYLLLLHPLASYPGPLLAKLTNFWRVFSFLNGTQYLTDYELHRRYGRFVRDGPNSLLISDVEAFKAIYGFLSTIEKSDFYAVTSNGRPHDPNVFAAKTEILHREAKRKLVSSAFAPKYVAQYEPIMRENVLKFLQRLQDEIEMRGRTINTAPWIERFVFDTLLQATYGNSMGLTAAGEDRFGIIDSRKMMYPITIAISHVPCLARIMALPAVSSFMRKPKYDKNGHPKGVSALAQWTRKVLDNAVQDSSNTRTCILKNLLDIDPADNKKLDLDMTRYECINVIFAGVGSTSAGLIAILYELGLHPAWQERLYTDLKAIENGQIPPTSRLSRTESLQSVIKEALRLHPPFSGPFERVIGSGGETTIPQTRPLPRNTRIWTSQYVICRSKDVFGADAEEFLPDRWLNSTEDRLKQMEDVFCAFGRGSRGCIGKDIAWMILEMTTNALIRKWKWSCSLSGLKGKDFFEMQYEKIEMSYTLRE